MKKITLVLAFTVLSATTGFAQELKKPVGIMTAVQAESELMFNNAIKRAGGINQFAHGRLPATPETQQIVRSQSDMLYSHGVFDASKGLTVTMPDQMTGYQSLHMFDASHAQVAVIYAGETRKISPNQISTTDKHVYSMMRTSTDRGIKIANKAQDMVKVKANSDTAFVGAGYNEAQLRQAKRVLAGAVPAGLVKARTAYADELVPDTIILKDASDIEKYHYIMSSLLGWGLMPNEHAYYPQLGVKESACTVVNFPTPPVQYKNGGYWSFTGYTMDGYLGTKNSVISSYGAKPNDDGSFTVHVGNTSRCTKALNHVDMPKGGAAITLRLYRPTNIKDAKAFETAFQKLNKGK
ncbi:MAG: hypothetical protein COB83_03590 [Gammaproteobacteria bacterium]|nr:MAG: hypothetical protein COB83_03590 [Gammaproteobacteria bacterium]